MHVRAILNPRAGLAARRGRAALARPPSAWDRLSVDETRGPGHAGELAAAAAREGVDLVLAIGGDGTVNEVAAGLLGTQVPLGLVPAGSGNGLARTFGLPLDPARALAELATGRDVAMDVGWANGRLFLNVSGTGYDAEVGEAFHQRGQAGGRRGIAPYVVLAIARLPRYRARATSLELNGVSHTLRPLVVAAFNGRQYGAGAIMAPGARLDDGQLQIVAIDHAPLPALLAGAARMFLGRVEGARVYHRWAATSAVLTNAGAWHRDGEPEAACDRLEWRAQPSALRVRVPNATLAASDGPFSTLF